MRTTRRTFVTSAASAAAGACAGLGFLSHLRPVGADEAELSVDAFAGDNGIEPTVKLLERTPRERLVEEVASRVKSGSLGYRELLAALLVAGVRNVQPRPQVGFKFHAVLVINSAHLASQASAGADRWLPIFWSLDRFKSAQVETQKSSGWRMGAVDESRVPKASKAREAFISAMDAWDEPAADAAAAAVARTMGRDEAFDLFARYGCRDFRDIGHKVIYTANSFRTLDAVGWQHAEPVLRSLAYALLKYDGENPAKTDAAPDQPGRRNAELAKQIRPEWADGQPNPEASRHLLEVFRTASPDESCDAVVKALNEGVAPQSIFDATLTASGELLMRRSSIVTLHSVTSSNALRYAYQAAGDTQTRLMLLLQNAAFVPLFRGAAGKLSDARVEQFQEGQTKPTEADEIFATVSKDRSAAAHQAYAYLAGGGDARALMTTARRLVFLKGNDAHDYKFSSAVLEDYDHLSPAYRNQYLATAMHYLPGSGAKENPLVERIRAALGAKEG